MVYVLLQSKSQADYERAFRKLLDSRNTWSPSSILLDFEKATLQASAIIFPHVTLTDCLIHLGQSLWHRIQNEGLVNNYRYDENVRMFIKTPFLSNLTILLCMCDFSCFTDFRAPCICLRVFVGSILSAHYYLRTVVGAQLSCTFFSMNHQYTWLCHGMPRKSNFAAENREPGLVNQHYCPTCCCCQGYIYMVIRISDN